MEPKHSRLPDLMGRPRGRSATLARSQAAEPRLGQRQMPLVATLTRAPARILVVDDQEDVRELLVVVLSAEGCVVDAAGNSLLERAGRSDASAVTSAIDRIETVEGNLHGRGHASTCRKG